MANASFTRDEVILALDVLYFSGKKHLTKNSQAIIDLCSLLQELPIHPKADRPETFRNYSGVSNQISKFRTSLVKGEKDPNVGNMFFQVYLEYENDLEELHKIADSIRRNTAYYSELFGDQREMSCFPEGALLEHLHRIIEQRDGENILNSQSCCMICEFNPSMVYDCNLHLLEKHLIVKPTLLNGACKYTEKDFIVVCPNCHAALHHHRPWLDSKNCQNIINEGGGK